MQPLKARVHNGRLILDAPTDLPDGAEVELVPIDGWDDLDEADRRRLHAALEESELDLAEGRVRSGQQVLEELRREAR